MKRKKTTTSPSPQSFITRVKGSGEVRQQVQRLRDHNYDVLMPGTRISKNAPQRSWSDLVSSQLRSGAMEDGKMEPYYCSAIYGLWRAIDNLDADINRRQDALCKERLPLVQGALK